MRPNNNAQQRPTISTKPKKKQTNRAKRNSLREEERNKKGDEDTKKRVEDSKRFFESLTREAHHRYKTGKCLTKGCPHPCVSPQQLVLCDGCGTSRV
jgi:hypothetical protein